MRLYKAEEFKTRACDNRRTAQIGVMRGRFSGRRLWIDVLVGDSHAYSENPGSMTLYGDLDYSVIDELPPRRPVITLFNAGQKEYIYRAIAEETKSGRHLCCISRWWNRENESQICDNREGGAWENIPEAEGWSLSTAGWNRRVEKCYVCLSKRARLISQ